MINPGRMITAMVTPFDDRAQLSEESTKRLVKHLVETGSDCILVSGTTGESPSLYDDEKLKLLKWVKSSVPGNFPVMFGAGTNSTDKSIDLGLKAKDAGADILLLVVPYYNKPPQEGIYGHFSLIADSVQLPCILYNIPSRTGVNMTTDTVLQLTENEFIIGIKEASGNIDAVTELRINAPDGFLIYSGDDSLTLPVLAAGGDGVISVASHIVGKKLKEMIAAFFSGDIARAQKIHLELYPIFKGLFLTTNPIPVKEALNQMGFDVGSVRPPLVECDNETRKKLTEILKTNKVL
jgi:4-hydroxy-tetrahydrodipicolinate synthase